MGCSPSTPVVINDVAVMEAAFEMFEVFMDEHCVRAPGRVCALRCLHTAFAIFLRGRVPMDFIEIASAVIESRIQQGHIDAQPALTMDGDNRMVHGLALVRYPSTGFESKQLQHLQDDLHVIKAQLDEIYFAPGMPGYERCKASFQIMSRQHVSP